MESGIKQANKKKAKKRNYTLDEVEEIYQIVANLYYQRMKTFKYLIIFLIAVVIMMLLLNYIYMEDKLLAVMSSLIIVANLYYQRMKTFKYLIIFLIAVVIMMLLLNYIYMEDKLLAVMSSLIVAGMMLMIMIFMYFMWVLQEKKQLLKGLAEGYPELVEGYEHKFEDKLNK